MYLCFKYNVFGIFVIVYTLYIKWNTNTTCSSFMSRQLDGPTNVHRGGIKPHRLPKKHIFLCWSPDSGHNHLHITYIPTQSTRHASPARGTYTRESLVSINALAAISTWVRTTLVLICSNDKISYNYQKMGSGGSGMEEGWNPLPL